MREALGGPLPAAVAKMKLYLTNPSTHAILFKPIKSNVAEAHGQVRAQGKGWQRRALGACVKLVRGEEGGRQGLCLPGTIWLAAMGATGDSTPVNVPDGCLPRPPACRLRHCWTASTHRRRQRPLGSHRLLSWQRCWTACHNKGSQAAQGHTLAALLVGRVAPLMSYAPPRDSLECEHSTRLCWQGDGMQALTGTSGQTSSPVHTPLRVLCCVCGTQLVLQATHCCEEVLTALQRKLHFTGFSNAQNLLLLQRRAAFAGQMNALHLRCECPTADVHKNGRG